jgi:hypothetical protein
VYVVENKSKKGINNIIAKGVEKQDVFWLEVQDLCHFDAEPGRAVSV